MKIAAQASALSGLGIGFEDDAIAEAFETALEVCDGSGREVAAKGETAGLVQHVEAFEKKRRRNRFDSTRARSRACKPPNDHGRIPGLQASPREGPESARKLIELTAHLRHCSDYDRNRNLNRRRPVASNPARRYRRLAYSFPVSTSRCSVLIPSAAASVRVNSSSFPPRP